MEKKFVLSLPYGTNLVFNSAEAAAGTLDMILATPIGKVVYPPEGGGPFIEPTEALLDANIRQMYVTG